LATRRDDNNEADRLEKRREMRRQANEMRNQVGKVVRDLAERPRSPQEEAEFQAMQVLGRLGDHRVNSDAIQVEGNTFIIPLVFQNDLGGAADFLLNVEEEQEKLHTFSRQYKARPWDGARATKVMLFDLFGTHGIGKSTFSFFGGERKPEYRSIPVGPRETEQVPWGLISLEVMKGTLELAVWSHKELGILFQLNITAPKKYNGYIEGFFEAVQKELDNNSIYRGRAIDGQEMPEFMDLSGVDPSQIVYTAEVERQLRANIWSLIDKYHDQKRMNLPMKRAVLLAGQYGTGKTEAARITALRAIKANPTWTFIHVRPGQDDIGLALATARLYEPSIVFIEDIDTHAHIADKDAVSWILEKFDGVSAKGTEIMILMTTNNPDQIVKGMLRPGRMDAVVEIGPLDTEGIERLIEALVPAELLDKNIDWEHIGNAAEGFLPAFLREMIDRAKRYALDQLDENQAFKLGTSDFADAALGLRTQLKMMQEAGEGTPRDALSEALKRAIAETINATAFVDSDGDPTNGEYATGMRVQNGNGTLKSQNKF